MTEPIKKDVDVKIDSEQNLDGEVKRELNIEEDINAIFSGEHLSEEFKQNAKAIFEAAVLAKVEEQKVQIEEDFNKKLEEEVASISENIVTKVDEYLEYVVTEWMEENKLAVESGIKSEIVEDFMVGLKNLFVEHYIDIPQDKVDMVEQLASKVEELEGELDKVVTENVNLSTQIGTFKKDSLITDVSEGLTEVQSAKLKSLAEGIEFVSEQDYKEKLALTKKKYFSEQKDDSAPVVKEQFGADDTLEDTQFSPLMEHYVKNISRTLKK
jgi:hypothetical protein